MLFRSWPLRYRGKEFPLTTIRATLDRLFGDQHVQANVELAALRLGVSRDTIYCWLRGERAPDSRALRRILRAQEADGLANVEGLLAALGEP